jgi:hypothetical protein
MTTFNTHREASPVEQLGRWAGRVYRCGFRQQERCERWMRSRGLSSATASILLGVARVLALVVLLAVVCGVALVVALFTAAAAAQAIAARREEQGTWRNGLQGYGLYKHGIRTDLKRMFETDERR